MKTAIIVILAIVTIAQAGAQVSDLTLAALLNRPVDVVLAGGKTASGELAAYDDTDLVMIGGDGRPVVLARSEITGIAVSKAPADGSAPASLPAAPGDAKANKGRFVATLNPLAPIAGIAVFGGLDLTGSLQFPVSPSLAVSAEPEIALGAIAGFALQAGIQFFPVAEGNKGPFIGAALGVGAFAGTVSPLISAGVGYQFEFGHFVFAPEIGMRFSPIFTILLKPSLGWAF